MVNNNVIAIEIAKSTCIRGENTIVEFPLCNEVLNVKKYTRNINAISLLPKGTNKGKGSVD